LQSSFAVGPLTVLEFFAARFRFLPLGLDRRPPHRFVREIHRIGLAAPNTSTKCTNHLTEHYCFFSLVKSLSFATPLFHVEIICAEVTGGFIEETFCFSFGDYFRC
jgi:hypothetical protein